ncbi:MAG: energy-converting NiFe hydrogenase A subunit EhaA, partial [Methanobrevibacter sp.]|nr:energy-converting NiFe hydrogenase A subunit EhaA [Methanobrevibacter sp.]
MFDLLYNTVSVASNGNFYGLVNIGISGFDILLAYIVAIICSIIVALILRLPLL